MQKWSNRVPCVAGALVVALTSVPVPARAASPEIYKLLDVLGDVIERVRADHVDPPSDDVLIEGAIEGLIRSLGTKDSYYNPAAYRAAQTRTRGEFGGLGIEVTMKDGAVLVVSPLDGTPAANAGIRTGDLITAIDGASLQGLTLAEAVAKMRGKPNTPIMLTVRREGEAEPKQIKVVRAVITIRAVRARLEGDVGYIRIASLNEKTEQALKEAVRSLRQSGGAGIRGYVLDLRNNPGGLLDQAIAVADSFLETGEIVSIVGRKASDRQRHAAKPGDLLSGKPLVVLINGGTASGSEIIAAALADHKRARLVGSKTFGNGGVYIIPLKGDRALRLATGRFYTPAGRQIEGKGVEPSVAVKLPPGKANAIAGDPAKDAALQRALALVREAPAPVPALSSPPKATGDGVPPGELENFDTLD